MPLVQCHGQPDPSYIKLAGAAAEGDLMPSTKLMAVGQLPDSDPQKKVIEEFVRLYTQVYHFDKEFPINTHSGYAWDAISLLAEAIRKAGSTDAEKIREALEGIKGHVGVSGVFSLSATDHNGLDENSMVMLKVKDGAFVLAD